MKTTSKKELKTKGGRVYPAGTEFNVNMPDAVDGQRNDAFAFADPMNGEKPIRIRTIVLGNYFKGFIKVTMAKIENYMENGGSICKSMTGEEVEPDGEDEHGFPSVLRAAGYV